jgi:NADPH:quinone reductase
MTMKAVMIREWTTPPQFPVEAVPDPVPGAGEVLVAVHTTGITFGDALVGSGEYQVRPKLPFTPGTECSGIVEAVGTGVTQYQPGDHVACIGFIGNSREAQRILGAYCDKVIAPLRNLVKVPKTADLEQAALFRSNAETGYFALQEGRLKPGETVIVLGAGGGTGHAAVALAKLMGATVIGSASSQDKRDIAIAAGADIAIDSNAEDWRAQVEKFVGKKGVDIIYDPIGGDQSDRAFRTLGYGGRHLVVGFAAGSIPKLALNLPLMKAASIVGANMLRGWENEPERVARSATYLMDLFGDGKLSVPPVARRYPLERAAEAVAEVRAGKTAGRIVLSIGSAR